MIINPLKIAVTVDLKRIEPTVSLRFLVKDKILSLAGEVSIKLGISKEESKCI